MHIIIAGCGRVGSQLAATLDRQGHDVVIIDKNPNAFRRLADTFGGEALPGIVFDRHTLEKARIKQASAFIAVTSGDNSNIVSARTAKERFGVTTVVARIYDPDRAVIYERHGITTVATARWTTESILRVVLPVSEAAQGSLGPGEGDVVLIDFEVPDGAHHVPAATVHWPGESVLAAVSRGGQTTVPGSGVLLESGDVLHLAVQRTALESVRQRLAEIGAVKA